MSERTDLTEELRRANPIEPDRLPSDSTARMWGRIQEAIVTEEATNSSPGRPRWQAWGAGLAGVAVAGAIAFAVLTNSGATPPDSGGTAATDDPGVGTASCVEMYSLDTLANRSWAFDGTVASISGDQVTFAVNESYRGELAGEVTLNANGMTGTSITSAGGPVLTQGGRFLVAGQDEFVWGCGFTQAYDADTAAQWADTLD